MFGQVLIFQLLVVVVVAGGKTVGIDVWPIIYKNGTTIYKEIRAL